MKEYNGKILIFSGGNQNEFNFGVPKEILDIADEWFEKSEAVGDKGSCVLGAKMVFKYEDKEYQMYPQSPWQGEGSWTGNVNHVQEALKKLGAKEIEWYYGILD